MTRKRFAKLCMGVLGMPRNEANHIAQNRNSYFGRWTLSKIGIYQEWAVHARRGKTRVEIR
jgi:hypothetical protein